MTVKERRNIIFIDIDGPLLPTRQWYTKENSKILSDAKGFYNVIASNFELKRNVRFDPVAVWMFNMWAKYSNALGVLSTNWMNHTSVEEMKELFKSNNLQIELHRDPITPKRMSSYRCNEIQWWIDEYADEIDKYIAVDDEWGMNPKQLATIGNEDYALMATRTIWVDDNKGLTRENFILGLDKFNIRLEDINKNEFGIMPKS